jgi:hypothetical protein
MAGDCFAVNMETGDRTSRMLSSGYSEAPEGQCGENTKTMGPETLVKMDEEGNIVLKDTA